MNSKTIDKRNYKLHLYKTDKFKSVELHVVLTNEAKEDNFLISALRELLYLTSGKYKTKRDRFIKEEDLYNESFDIMTDRYGRMNSIDISCMFINPKLVNDDYAEEAIKYPLDIFNNPIFDEDRLNEVKDKMKFNFKRMVERPAAYAYRQALDLYFDDPLDNVRFNVEDKIVDTITMKQIEDKYNEIINNSNVDVFLLGDYDDKWIDFIDNNLKFKSVNKELNNYVCNPLTNELKTKVETKPGINQAQIYNIYNIPKLSGGDRVYLALQRLIIGGGQTGRLFQIVREQHHLCYDIHSSFNAYSCNYYIYTGVDKENVDKAKELITEIVNSMISITDEELDIAKNKLLNSYESIYDSLEGIYNRVYGEILLGRIPLDEEINITKQATKEDIIKTNEKIILNTEYVLKGEE